MIDSRITQKIKEIEENIELIKENLPEVMKDIKNADQSYVFQTLVEED